MFHVGQKVVCVAGPNAMNEDEMVHPALRELNHPKVGTVYTVREIVVSPRDVTAWGLRLNEIHNERIKYAQFPEPVEHCFSRFRFRPVVERKASIAVFEEILKRETLDEPVKTHKKERA